MNIKLIPLNEIEAGINNFDFIETNSSKIPIMGRIIIGNSPGDPSDENWKIVVLEIGLEYTTHTGDYRWYWEISIRDSSNTETILKKHDTEYTAQYKPSCRGCSIIPLEIHGDTPQDFSQTIMDDIIKNFAI